MPAFRPPGLEGSVCPSPLDAGAPGFQAVAGFLRSSLLSSVVVKPPRAERRAVRDDDGCSDMGAPTTRVQVFALC